MNIEKKCFGLLMEVSVVCHRLHDVSIMDLLLPTPAASRIYLQISTGCVVMGCGFCIRVIW